MPQTSCQCSLKRSLPGFAQDLLKSSPEVLVENRVDDGVEGAVAVTDPEEKLEKGFRDGAGLPADPVKAVAEEEREPADHEHPHDHGQHEGEPLLSCLGNFLSRNGVPPFSAGGKQVQGLAAGSGLSAGVLGAGAVLAAGSAVFSRGPRLVLHPFGLLIR